MTCGFNGMPYVIPFEYDSKLSIYENVLEIIQNIKIITNKIEKDIPVSIKKEAEQTLLKSKKYTDDSIKHFDAKIETIEKTFTNTLNEYKKENETKIDYINRKVDENYINLKNYSTELYNQLNILILSLQQEFYELKKTLNYEIDARFFKLKEELKELTGIRNGDNIIVFNPEKNTFTSLKDALCDIYNYYSFGALTAGEYDSLNFSAQDYDVKNVHGIVYDRSARFTFFDELYIEKIYNFINEENDRIEKRIAYIEKGLIKYSPISATYKSLYDIILELIALHQQSYTAADFDILEKKSLDYDNLNISAYDYDFSSLNII